METVELIGFPDIEEILSIQIEEFFNTRGIPIHAGNKVPSPMPKEFVVVLRTGGPRRDFYTDNPLVTIEVYAERDSRAYELINLLRAWIVTLSDVGGNAVYNIEEAGGIGNLPDPVTKKPRYTTTYSLAVRGYTI